MNKDHNSLGTQDVPSSAILGDRAPRPKTVSEILSAAADLIEPEGRWTQHSFGRGPSGRDVSTPRNATCFCIIGAVAAAMRPRGNFMEYGTDCEVALDVIRTTIHAIDLTGWNDAPERKQSEVVAALRAASKLAEAS